MAKIVVENATVERVFETKHGWGVRVAETVRRRGEDVQERVTAWFYGDRFGIEEGDVVSLAGTLSTRVREYEVDGEKRHAADVSMNSPRLIAAVGLPSPTPAYPGMTREAWDDMPEMFKESAVQNGWTAPEGEEF